jgi:hypothetical protein
VANQDDEAFAYEIFHIPEELEIRFATLSSESQQRTLALIEAPGHAASLGDARRAATVIQVASVAKTLAAATGLGLKTCRPRTSLDPAKGPPRTESAFYDHDGHTVVLYNLEDPP